MMIVVLDAFNVEAQILVSLRHFTHMDVLSDFTMTRARHQPTVIALHASRLVQPREQVGGVVSRLPTKSHILALLYNYWPVHVT